MGDPFATGCQFHFFSGYKSCLNNLIIPMQLFHNFIAKLNMKQNNSLFILSNGRVAAINKKDGSIVWEVKLKQYLSGTMTMSFGQINVEDNKIFIGCSGIMLCLSTKDGSLLWKNELKGWGYNFVSMANGGNDAAMAAAITAAAATTAVVAAT